MRTLTLLILLASLSVAALAKAPTYTWPEPTDIIRKQGYLVITDGSSYYDFKKNGQFFLTPCGEGGRAISGRWHIDSNGAFVVDGYWGWINGVSQDNAHRRMTLQISECRNRHTLFNRRRTRVPRPTVSDLYPETTVYDCYFVIEELVPLTKPHPPADLPVPKPVPEPPAPVVPNSH